ncbi:hypothetical protein CFOL_v3_17188 [Cephalotus follicularis]|uniref:Uncharacterized protein n=1 Tax=Cephalotus follicularis TaxID=3775 RepID=A0A1Q3C0C3_CEPFO|nr:hypothetical protein CFOL_v3_17188 [Cephalotus follicularis]
MINNLIALLGEVIRVAEQWVLSLVKLQMALEVSLEMLLWHHLRLFLAHPASDICTGSWDFVCFIEHLCVSNLVKLLLILALCYIILMFCYLLLKVGICQCIARSLCKICWASCETYWFALEDTTCFLWHKLKNTKRVSRRRFRDVETGYSSSESDFTDNYHHLSVDRKRKLLREARRRGSLYLSRRYSSHIRDSHHHHRHHHVKLKTKEVPVHAKDRSRRRGKSRPLQLIKSRNPRGDVGIFKRRRLW